MGYVAGESILDDEFNAFVGSTTNGFEGINHTMGTGTANLGLGLTGTVATTNAGATVQASQWNALFTGMDNVQNHTNVSALASTTARSAGNTIAASAQLNTDLQALVTAVEGGSVGATAITEGSELQSSVSSAVWSGSHIVEHSFTFDGGDEARYFFNAGGKIRVKITNAAANSTSKDTSMSGLITSMGNFDLGATVCARAGSGDTLTTDGSALGYFDMTTSYQTLIQVTESAGSYTSNYIRIEAKCGAGAHADARGNTGNVVTIKTSLVDADGTDTLYTSGNLSSVNVNAEQIGITDIACHTVNPTTAQGLAQVYTIASSAVVSNTTA